MRCMYAIWDGKHPISTRETGALSMLGRRCFSRASETLSTLDRRIRYSGQKRDLRDREAVFLPGK
jgi:hypothetical protein